MGSSLLSTMLDLIVRGGKIFTAGDVFEKDVGIKDGKISEISSSISDTSAEVVDAKGKYILPGLIDGHTHMEFPFMGTVTVDDFYHGTKAALGGGVTTIVDFISPAKGQNLLDAYDVWRGNADPKVVSDYSLHSIIREASDENLKQIPEMVRRGVTSFKLFMAYKGELMMEDGDLYRTIQAITDAKGVVAIHAENGEIVSKLTEELLVGGKKEAIYHYHSRPEPLEYEAANRIAVIASTVGKDVKLYLVHTSTGEAVDIMSSYRMKGYNFFNETTPNYLIMDNDILNRQDGYRLIMSPPFREKDQLDMLWERLAYGEIQTIGSDHCVYSDEQKRRYKEEIPSFNEVPNGVPGVETILPLMFHYGVKKGRIDMQRLVEVTSANPAKLFGLYPRKGSIMPGSDADIAVLDPDRRMKISADVLHSNIDYSIFEGMEVEGWPHTTIRRGEVVFTDGEVTAKPGSGKYIPGTVE